MKCEIKILLFLLILFLSGCTTDTAVPDGDADNFSDGDMDMQESSDSDSDLEVSTDGDSIEIEIEIEIELSPCDPNPCSEPDRSICIETDDGEYTCNCNDGLADYGDGECKPADPCKDDTDCKAIGRMCENELGVAKCGECAAGFKEISSECKMDFTFYGFGDPQYGGGESDKNDYHIAAMNMFSQVAVWPDDSQFPGEAIDEPLGVIIAGDLTQNGRDDRPAGFLGPGRDQLGPFLAEYGLDGSDGKLVYPVYEGVGNHDFEPAVPGEYIPIDWRYNYVDDPTPVVDTVARRNEFRIGITSAAEYPAGHYSWDWGWVHFVHVNIFPGDEPSDGGDNSAIRDPRESLTFMVDDLEKHVGDSGRPVVIIAHFGFDSFSREERWWKPEQIEKFLEAIAPYNMIAYIHGHVHGTNYYTQDDLDIFNVGSPYYSGSSGGHFTVFRITEEVLEVRDVKWTPDMEAVNPRFTNLQFSKALTR